MVHTGTIEEVDITSHGEARGIESGRGEEEGVNR